MSADLAAIEARAKNAFPGPWKAWDRGIGYEIHTIDDEPLNYNHRETFGRADATFIAHARTDVPALLAMVRERDAKLAAVRAIIDEEYRLWAAVCGNTCGKDILGVDHEAIASEVAAVILQAMDPTL